MKKLLIISILFIYNSIIAQNSHQDLTVLMIGASHSYDPKSNQDLTGIHAKIRAFKPNAFFGEWMAADDEKALKDYWNKAGVIKRTERLKARKNIAESDLPKEIVRLENLVDKSPKDMKAKIDLAVVNYLAYDAANGYFQLWKVAKHLQKNPTDTMIINYARKAYFSAEIDSLHKIVKTYVDDEYDYIAHPMMVEMGMKKMYAMDSQRWDGEWSKAWSDADSVFWGKMEVYKKDSTSEMGIKVNALRKQVKSRMTFLEDEAEKIYGSNQATEALNGPQYAEWLFKMNFYANEYRDLDFFPADYYGQMTHYWWKRNNDMCNNTINRAKANGFKKVVIVVGGNHREAMTQGFIEKGIKVVNINDAPLK